MEKVPSPTADKTAQRQLTFHRHFVATSLLILLVTGCEYTPPDSPESFPVAILRGRITAAGKIVSEGWITLMPIDGAIGDSTVGRIHPTGEFRFENAPVGPLQIRLRISPNAVPELLRSDGTYLRKLGMLQGNGSPLRVTTLADRESVFNFDVVTSPMR